MKARAQSKDCSSGVRSGAAIKLQKFISFPIYGGKFIKKMMMFGGLTCRWIIAARASLQEFGLSTLRLNSASEWDGSTVIAYLRPTVNSRCVTDRSRAPELVSLTLSLFSPPTTIFSSFFSIFFYYVCTNNDEFQVLRCSSDSSWF